MKIFNINFFFWIFLFAITWLCSSNDFKEAWCLLLIYWLGNLWHSLCFSCLRQRLKSFHMQIRIVIIDKSLKEILVNMICWCSWSVAKRIIPYGVARVGQDPPDFGQPISFIPITSLSLSDGSNRIVGSNHLVPLLPKSKYNEKLKGISLCVKIIRKFKHSYSINLCKYCRIFLKELKIVLKY